MRFGYAYILTNGRNGTLYVGVTSDLRSRIEQHRRGTASAFTRRYKLHTLVYYERHDLIAAAIQRETSIKRWPRKFKLNLIESVNPDWRDLADDLHML